MNVRIHSLAVIATTMLASSSAAQVSFPEVEPNSQKSEATPVVGIVSGDSITGLSTGTTTTLGSTLGASVDMYRIKTGPLAVGIYKHQLVLTTTGTAGHTGSLRGLNQTGTVGVGGTAGSTDTDVQASTTTPTRMNEWYGFGKQEEIYYRVVGAVGTTAPYAATLTTTSVSPTLMPQSFESANPITIQTVTQTTVDTEIFLYDSNMNAIVGGLNDDEGIGGATAQSRLIRTLAPGAYALAISNWQTQSNQVAANDDDYVIGYLMDFPDCMVRSTNSTVTADWDVMITGSNGTLMQTNQLPANAPFDVTWIVFNVVLGAPPIISPPPANDLCANATPVASGSTTAGTMLGALNDGSATCDPGGAASRDVWYSYTNTSAAVQVFSADTCTTSFDTVLTVYAACGGAELGCSDDCAGPLPCAATTSCVSGILLNPSQVVVLRVSDKGLGGGPNFTLHVSGTPLPPANDDCSNPTPLPGPGVYAFDTTAATTGSQGQGAMTGCTLGGAKKDLWYTYPATTNGGTVTVSTSGGQITSVTTDTIIAVYAGTGCPAGLGIACDDDGGGSLTSTVTFTTTCGVVYLFQVGAYSATGNITGTFTVTETGGACATPFTTSCYGDGSGTACPCGNAGIAGRGCANGSFPSGAQLSSTGIASISADTLILHGFNGSAFGAGLYFQGSANNSPSGAPFGHGIVCMSGATPRLEIVNPQDVNGASQTAGILHNEGGISSPGTYHYQWWYRDAVNVGTCSSGGSAFNFSNAITLTWAP